MKTTPKYDIKLTGIRVFFSTYTCTWTLEHAIVFLKSLVKVKSHRSLVACHSLADLLLLLRLGYPSSDDNVYFRMVQN